MPYERRRATRLIAMSQVRFPSNKVGPRLSGPPQAAAALKYIALRVRELGLANLSAHRVAFRRSSNTETHDECSTCDCVCNGHTISYFTKFICKSRPQSTA